MNGKFNINIRLGNAAMQSPEHVAEALRKVADELDSCMVLESEEGRVRDFNGNTVGGWDYKVHEIDVEDAPYELSDNQREFVEDALDAGLDVDFSYSGRGMYGNKCPAVRVDGMAELETSADTKHDSMGLGFVIYAQY